ncbi:hypothetical protein I546_1135 [Mycobacterium kansasii 732]|nr:hypothetical protein I546_1135 [Mycobacterium kansasii 732]
MVLWAPMPKAAVEKDGDAFCREYQIGCSSYVAKGASGYPVTESKGMTRRPQR